MKALGLFLGALVAFSLVACSDGGSGSNSGGSAGSTNSGGSTGGSTGGSGGSTNTGGSTGGAPALTCDDYCAEIAQNCTGDLQQYVDDTSCKGICAKFDPGTLADMGGSTLGCRLYHGGDPAKSNPTTHCPHAGPLGDGTCGDDCANFCDLAVAVCGSQATPPYASKDDCMTACAGFPDTTAVPYSAMVNSGDSLACRMYHLSVAAQNNDNAMTHCPHVAAVSSQCK